MFDMGNVLAEYDGDLRVCRGADSGCGDEGTGLSPRSFVSPEWVKLDMGIISEEQGLKADGEAAWILRRRKRRRPAALPSGIFTTCGL